MAGLDTVFLNCVHSFRAVAIFFVVAGHCIGSFARQVPWHEHLTRSILQNGTVFFVFIAGSLFQHLSHRFEYRHYLKGKLQTVILPCAILSVPILVYLA